MHVVSAASLTPVSSKALEEIKESEPWNLAPPLAFETNAEQTEAGTQSVETGNSDLMQAEVVAPETMPQESATSGMAASESPASHMAASDDFSSEMSTTDLMPWDVAPWDATQFDAAPLEPAPVVNHIVDALMRIAARVRDGELDVPAGAEMSDEAVLSVVLTSLLRMRR